METKKANTRGFTIVELLTVMAVIAVLIGLLIPALSLVKDNAKKIQQKAQFHSIDVGLGLYKSEYGAYPESKDNSMPTVDAIDPTVYCGANKLAEAMVGWDFLGYHPKSGYTADGFNDLDGDGTPHLVYEPINGIANEGAYNEANGDENIENRKNFIGLENANAFQMQDIYTPATVTTEGWTAATNLVLGDVYAKNRLTGKKAGMPILYFRARPGYKFQDSANDDNGSGAVDDDEVYDYRDNQHLLQLQSPEDITILHPLADEAFADDLLDFDDIIVNQQILNTSGLQLPYRAESYFLLSAGKDGLYGTADDILNFEKEITE